MLTCKNWKSGEKAAAYYLGEELTDQVDKGIWVGRGKSIYPGIPDIVDSSTLIQMADFSGNYSSQRNAVVDYTLTAPKAVSVYAALTDEEKRNKILVLQVAAARKVMEQIEADHSMAKMSYSTAEKIIQATDKRLRPIRLGSKGRRKKDDTGADAQDKEQVYLRTHNLLAALFTHFCTRPVDGVPDPNIHTHCVIPRITHRPDKESVTLYLDVDLPNPPLNQLYIKTMIDGLTRMGIPASYSESLDIVIEGISDDLLNAFSLRSKKIGVVAEAMMPEAGGEAGPVEKRLAALYTRETKDSVRWTERLPGWRMRAIAATVGEEILQLNELLSDEQTKQMLDRLWHHQEHAREKQPRRTGSGLFPGA
jgi:hypothetical protein